MNNEDEEIKTIIQLCEVIDLADPEESYILPFRSLVDDPIVEGERIEYEGSDYRILKVIH